MALVQIMACRAFLNQKVDVLSFIYLALIMSYSNISSNFPFTFNAMKFMKMLPWACATSPPSWDRSWGHSLWRTNLAFISPEMDNTRPVGAPMFILCHWYFMNKRTVYSMKYVHGLIFALSFFCGVWVKSTEANPQHYNNFHIIDHFRSVVWFLFPWVW